MGNITWKTSKCKFRLANCATDRATSLLISSYQWSVGGWDKKKLSITPLRLLSWRLWTLHSFNQLSTQMHQNPTQKHKCTRIRLKNTIYYSGAAPQYYSSTTRFRPVCTDPQARAGWQNWVKSPVALLYIQKHQLVLNLKPFMGEFLFKNHNVMQMIIICEHWSASLGRWICIWH